MALAELKSNAVERRNFLAPSLKLDDQKFEFIFILDRSGSMHGEKIILARRALALFLRSLPTTCIFNVIGFGSSHTKLFSSSVPYDQRNLDFATDHANSVDADLGGTRLVPPLEDIYRCPQTPGYLAQIFFLTDGETEEGAHAVISMIKARKPFARIFSLGIGHGADVALINGVAAAGGGVPEFVKEGEKIETKILDQLKIALRPSLLKPVRVA